MTNVRFPESRHSEYTFGGRSERPLLAVSRRSFTVNMQAGAYPLGFPVAVIVRWAFDRTLEVEFNETDSILSFLD